MREVEYQFVPISRWPGKPTEERVRARFDSSWAQTMDLLARELSHLDAENIVIQADCDAKDIRLDGMFRSSAKLRGPGVILTFDSAHGPLSYPCDTYDHWQDNVRAIGKALEALRAVDRYGVTQNGQQYTGWAKLPGPTQPDTGMSVGQAAAVIAEFSTSGHIPRDVLESPQSYLAAARSARSATHPDRNAGSRGDWDEVQKAIEVLNKHHKVNT